MCSARARRRPDAQRRARPERPIICGVPLAAQVVPAGRPAAVRAPLERRKPLPRSTRSWQAGRPAGSLSLITNNIRRGTWPSPGTRRALRKCAPTRTQISGRRASISPRDGARGRHRCASAGEGRRRADRYAARPDERQSIKSRRPCARETLHRSPVCTDRLSRAKRSPAAERNVAAPVDACPRHRLGGLAGGGLSALGT